jgi:general secretion pathway protein G
MTAVATVSMQSMYGRSIRGFTLLEVMVSAVILVLLATVAVPSYRGVLERQKIEQCVRDLALLGQVLERYRTTHSSLPETLAELNGSTPKDPWGFDYRFLNFNSSAPGVQGKIRKDHNLHPLNAEFDLYSVGPDGESSPPLTAKPSRDDVIWARDGNFIGLAADY